MSTENTLTDPEELSDAELTRRMLAMASPDNPMYDHLSAALQREEES